MNYTDMRVHALIVAVCALCYSPVVYTELADKLPDCSTNGFPINFQKSSGMINITNTALKCRWIIKSPWSLFETGVALYIYKSYFIGDLKVYKRNSENGNITDALLVKDYLYHIRNDTYLKSTHGFIIEANLTIPNYGILKFGYFSYMSTSSEFGSIHLLIGDSISVSRQTAGYYIRRVSQLLRALANRFVVFPTGQDAITVKTDFAKVAGFPNVLGCVDGTHIRIIRPVDNEVDFVSRKGYHSLNVQMCCDSTFRIRSCTARWPGSVHDSRVFRNSALCAQFEDGQHNGFLLGDSGYPNKRYLLTPFLQPATAAEGHYNRSLCRTRVIIEQTYGILKKRFQCLHKELQTTPEQAITYIFACVTLHNIGIERGDILAYHVDDDDIDDNDLPDIPVEGVNDGAAMRNHIVQTFFN